MAMFWHQISIVKVWLILVDHCMDNEICGVHGQCLNQPEEDTPDDRGYICVCEDGWKGINCNECMW